MAKFDFGSLDAPTFEADWPVTVSVPQDGGVVSEQTFMGRFRWMKQDELEAATKAPADGSEGVDPLTLVFLGFGGEEKTKFTPELLAKMLGRPYVRMALNKAYSQFSLGIAAKNS